MFVDFKCYSFPGWRSSRSSTVVSDFSFEKKNDFQISIVIDFSLSISSISRVDIPSYQKPQLGYKAGHLLEHGNFTKQSG